MEVGPQRRVVPCGQGRCLHLVRPHGHLSDEIFSQAIDDLPDCLRRCADRLEGPLPQALSKREPDEMSGYSLWSDQYECGGNPIVAGEEAANNDLTGDAPELRVLYAGCGSSRNGLRLTDLYLALRCFVLSHVECLARLLCILSDLLKPGGRLIVSDFYPFFLLSVFRTSFSVEDDDFVVPNTTHLLSDYVRELKAVSIDLLDVLETELDPAYPRIPHKPVLSGRKCGLRTAKAV